MLLMGRRKPTYTPHIDTGDHVIVVNAAKVKLTGAKEQQKLYRRHTGYPGGLIETGATKMRATRPAKMVELAVSGMLPKTKLGKQESTQIEGVRWRPASTPGAEACRTGYGKRSEKVREEVSASEVDSAFGNWTPKDRYRACYFAARQGTSGQ